MQLKDPNNLKSVLRFDKWLPDFLILNRLNPTRLFRLKLRLFDAAIRHKNINWPRQIGPFIRGKDVLDIGCGRSLFSIGFMYAGARSYTGVDPGLDLDSNVLKDSSSVHGKFKVTEWTPRQISKSVQGIQYVSGLTADLPPNAQYDVLVMHNVTEHLMEIETTIAEFTSRLRPGGLFVFRHPNYYSWGGHHMQPRLVSEIVDGDEDQAKYMDWQHLRERPDWPAKITKKQNRIRLCELRQVVERHFEITLWQTRQSLPNEGGNRLTPEILERYREFTKEDLLTQSVICVAKCRLA